MSENRSLQSATPDDTFIALCRTPYNEFRRRYVCMMMGPVWDNNDRERLMKENGWTLREFVSETQRRGKNLPHD